MSGARERLLIAPRDAPSGAVLLHAWRSDRDATAPTEAEDARVVDVITELSGREGAWTLPDPGNLEARIRGWGITAASPVVIHASEFSMATRAWFALRWAGVADVRILEGSPAEWAPRESPQPGHSAPFSIRPGSLPVFDAAQAADAADRGLLLDGRSGLDYLGETPESAGHIPGATWAPSFELARNGRLLPAGELRRWLLRVGAIGVHPIGAYCGTSIGSSALVFAMATWGLELPLFTGSWPTWLAEGRPVVSGSSGPILRAGDRC